LVDLFEFYDDTRTCRLKIYEAVFLFLGENLSIYCVLCMRPLRASEPVWTLWIEGKFLRRAENHTLIPG